MKDVPATPGLTIVAITLRSAAFKVLAEETPAKKRLQTAYELTDVREDEQGLFVSMRLKVDGFCEEARIWEASCEYLGHFRIEPGCPLTRDQVLEHHAPAYLYGFGRELIADLGRRSQRLVVLSPASFRPSQAEVAKKT